jgi:putative peptidoglycan lipid II flippase
MTKQVQNESSTLRRGTAIVGSLTLLSRLLGFIREVLIARLFGASSLADTFFVAFRIPNLLRSIFAEGALTSAFVPVFAEQLKHGQNQAKDAFCSIATLLLIITSILTVIGIYFASQIVTLIAPGFVSTPERFNNCVLLTQIMLPYIIFVSFIALVNGTLNSVKIFGISAFAQVVMNITLIIGAFTAGYFEAYQASCVLAWSVIVGGFVQVVSQLPALKRAGFPIFFIANPISKSSIEVCNLILPAILGATVYQLTIFINTQIASDLEPGSVSWLSYADRLVQLPIGVFTIALSSVLLPTLSKSLVDKDEKSFSENLINALRYTSLVIIPMSVMLMIFSKFFVAIIFQRGAFDQLDTQQTASIVAAYSFGLFAVSAHSLMIRAIQAKKDTVTPALIGIVTLVITLILSLIFIGKPYSHNQEVQTAAFSVTHLRESLLQFFQTFLPNTWNTYISNIELGAVGLALASSIAMIISMLICMLIIKKRHPLLKWTGFIRSICEVSVATLLAWSSTLFILNPVFSFVIFNVILLLLLFLMGNKEFKETFDLIRRYYLRVIRKHSN